MWEALQRSLPSIRPFAASNAQDVFPQRSQARWRWHLFNTDSAKSCKRLVAFAESKILAEDDHALCAAVWCNIHLAHLPLKSIFSDSKLIGKMYRAALVFRTCGYGNSVLLNVARHIAHKVAPVHNYTPSQEDAKALNKLLQIGLDLILPENNLRITNSQKKCCASRRN